MATTRTGMDGLRNGAPPTEAACLYEGKVMHQRMNPFGHRFSYSVFSLMIDLDRLDEANGAAGLFSVDRFNWLAFHQRDHLDAGERDLAAVARERFRKGGVAEPLSRILLVCYPRVFGIVFNPLAVYYGYTADGRLAGLIYEVRNTFGGRHRYVLPADSEETSPTLRQTAAKIFHVSPFMDMDMRYHFRMMPPGREIRWHILETDPEKPLLAATFSGAHRPLTNAAILEICARIPLLPLTVLGGIHWQALKLWMKGAKFHPTPANPVIPTDSPQLPKSRFDTKVEREAPLAR